MGSFSNITANINTSVYENTTQDITGTVLNTVLNNIVSVLGTNGNFMGIATPATVPAIAANVDGKQWYIATQAGVYNAIFGGVTLAAGDIYLFYCDSTGWHSNNITSSVVSRLASVESSVSQMTSAVMGDLCVNIANAMNTAYSDKTAARLAVDESTRLRFMMLRYIYLEGATPTLRIEMYTENQNGDITDNSIWSDDSNWTTVLTKSPLSGFVNS